MCFSLKIDAYIEKLHRKLWKESKEDDNKNSCKDNNLLKTKKKS